MNDVKAKVRINAQGLAVAPGFIDSHAHTNMIRNPNAQRKIFQGVTLDITGPDGGSSFPLRLKRGDAKESPQSVSGFSNYSGWIDSYKNTPIAMNLGSFVVFDAENITDKATYVKPGQYCQGVVHLVVNGKQVIKNSKQTNAMPGGIVSRKSA